MNELYCIKTVPQDFIVEEVPRLEFSKEGEEGNISYVEATKEGMNTEQAIAMLAESFHVDRKRIQASGLKDKKAITTQVFSVENVPRKTIERFSHERLKLRFLGYGKEHVFTGSHSENRFIITIHFTSPHSAAIFRKGADGIKRHPLMLNYYDEQRFSESNVKIGACLLRKKYKEACMLLQEDREHGAIVSSHLERRQTDYVGALKQIQKSTITIYIHAVQARIFNAILAEFARKECSSPNSGGPGGIAETAYSQGTLVFAKEPSSLERIREVELPVPGYGLEASGEVLRHIDAELAVLGIGERDFVNRQIPYLSADTQMRKAAVPVKEFKILEETPEKAKVSFILGKGSYATMLVRQMFLGEGKAL